jgi:hypothetical protein
LRDRTRRGGGDVLLRLRPLPGLKPDLFENVAQLGCGVRILGEQVTKTRASQAPSCLAWTAGRL